MELKMKKLLGVGRCSDEKKCEKAKETTADFVYSGVKSVKRRQK